MKKMFKKYAKNIITGKPRTAIEVAVELHNKGHRAIVMVVGSDRVQEFDKLLNEYNGVEGKRHGYYGFDNIEVVSAGERDPDAEGVSGMSASKMRAAAADGDKDSFLTGLPSGFKDGEKLYRDVRKYMGIREERDMGDMSDFETVRDMFLTGKIWNAGDIVEANGVTGEVVRKGTNYLSFVDEDGKVHKAWLHEITIDEEGISPALRRALDKKPMPQRYRVFDSKGEEVTVVQGPMKTKSSIDAFERRVKDKFIYTNPPYTVVDTKTNKVERMIEEVELDERNYRKEYDNYQGRPEQIARRSSRNKARRIMGDKTKIGMDVGHKDNNPMNNDPSNLRNEVPSDNRREPRLREIAGRKLTATDQSELYRLTALAMKKPGGSPAQKAIIKKLNVLRKKQGLKPIGEAVELDELSSMLPWLDRAAAKVSQITHPKGWDRLVKQYVDGMKDKEHQAHPGAWAAEIARRYRSVNGRDLVQYINKLVDKGKLPKELKAELEPQKEQWNFKDFVEKINRNAKNNKRN